MTWEIHLKTKVQLGQTEHLNSPQNLLLPTESTFPKQSSTGPNEHLNSPTELASLVSSSCRKAVPIPAPRLTAWTCDASHPHSASCSFFHGFPPSFLSPLGFQQKTQRTFVSEGLRHKRSWIRLQGSSDMGQGGQVMRLVVQGVTLVHALSSRQSIPGESPPDPSPEGLCSELQPTLGAQGLINMQTSQADDLSLNVCGMESPASKNEEMFLSPINSSFSPLLRSRELWPCRPRRLSATMVGRRGWGGHLRAGPAG